MTAQGLRRIIGWAGVIFMVGSGLWAFTAPRSFYNTIATFEPYNRHVIHDIGCITDATAKSANATRRLERWIDSLAGSER
jgi:hypothetical protein